MLLETCKLQYRGNSRRRQAVQKNRCAAAFWKPTGRTCSCYRAAYRVILVRLEISYGKRERERERELAKRNGTLASRRQRNDNR